MTANAQAPPLHHVAVFVGRERELDLLRESLAAAMAGQGRLVMLAGDPGIGKTRLAEEFAAHATAKGVCVRWGRCWEGKGAPAFWPWIQILRTQTAASDAEDLQTELGTGAGDVVRLVPDLQARVPSVATAGTLEDNPEARFRLLDSVASFLKNSASRQPLVLILDDLQWADQASLGLLRFLADGIQESRLLVVGTYRNVEIGAPHPLADLLGAFPYPPVVERVELEGLAKAEIGALLEALGRDAPASLVGQIHRDSGGNPFFVSEIVHGLDDGKRGSERLPGTVRDAIGHRLRRLSEECVELLRVASVIGPEFELGTLEKVHAEASSVSTPVVSLLTDAIKARIVDELAGAAGAWRFSHALLREVLYAAVPLEQRLSLHWEIASALEALGGPQRGRGAAALEHHFLEAIAGRPEGESRATCIDKALFYSTRAAEQATAMVAYEEAGAHYARALRVLEGWAPQETRRRCELLLDLGTVQARSGASLAVRRKPLERAAALARELDEPDLLARAAVCLVRYNSIVEAADARCVALLREALAALGPQDSIMRARLLAFLAVATYFPDPRTHSASLSREALTVARRVGDPLATLNAMISRWIVLVEPEHAEERRALATEILQLAEQVDARVGEQKERELTVRLLLTYGALQRGEVATVQHELAVYTQLADTVGFPSFRSRAVSVRAALALLAGRFAEAEQLVWETQRLMQTTEDFAAAAGCLYQTYWIYCEQGRLGEIEALVKGLVEQSPAVVGELGLLAHFCAEAGRVDEARAEIERLSADNFKAVPRYEGWLLQMALLADACAVLDNSEQAATLYELLLPYARYPVYDLLGPTCLGSVSFFLGQLAGTMGRWDDALRHLDEAIARNEQLGSCPWVANAQCAAASVLIARDRQGDRQRASALLAKALKTAEELGMRRLEHKACKLQEQLDSQSPGVAQDLEQQPAASEVSPPLQDAGKESGSTAPEQLTANLRSEGDYWVVGYEPATFRLKDRRGLHYLAILLRNPDREFLAIDLVAAVRGGHNRSRPDDGARGPVLGGGEPYFDMEARTAYEHRVKELHADLEEAEGFNDLDRASRTRAEIEFLTEELHRGLGLGHRIRTSGSPLERARVSVTLAIKSAVRAIAKNDARLGHQLSTTIKTGTYCSYNPAPGLGVTWQP
jgi:tetratricopeptide (TPR) repeat protein